MPFSEKKKKQLETRENVTINLQVQQTQESHFVSYSHVQEGT